jgi:hypothetical protein
VDFDITGMLIRAPVIFFALTIHEFMHAWTAWKCGDDTALRAGRVTFNPLAHLDPVGTVLLFFGPIGWAKPVPVDPTNFDYETRRRDEILVSGAGVTANFVLGAASALDLRVYIPSPHRGHGDSLAKGCAALRLMSEEQLRRRVPQCPATGRAGLLEAALEEHVYRAVAELFGKEEGYCKGRGGGMHIADFTVGHLGANAIVGGGVPIATGAAMAVRYLRSGKIVCCFAGSGLFVRVKLASGVTCCQQGSSSRPSTFGG